jgi:hypothetical protein
MLAATALFIAISFLGPIRWPHALASCWRVCC